MTSGIDLECFNVMLFGRQQRTNNWQHISFTRPTCCTPPKYWECLLACLVVSKNLGIGIAERVWKQWKAMKKTLRACTSSEKVKNQVQVYGAYQELRSLHNQTRASTAGTLWEEADFRHCKMSPYCKKIIAALEETSPVNENAVQVVCCWEEE